MVKLKDWKECYKGGSMKKKQWTITVTTRLTKVGAGYNEASVVRIILSINDFLAL